MVWIVLAACGDDPEPTGETGGTSSSTPTGETGSTPTLPDSGSTPTGDTGETPTIGTGSYLALSAGEDLTCGLLGTGEVACAGSTPWAMPPPPPGPFVAVAAAWDTGCAIRESGEIACWGCDWLSDLCDAPSGSDWQAIDGSDSWFCATDSAGRASCWGLTYGWYDDPDVTYSAFAVGVTGFVGIRAADGHVVGAAEAGDLPGAHVEIGAGRSAVCGLSAVDGSTACVFLEVPDPPASGLVEIDGYDADFCWLDADSHVGCSRNVPDPARDGFDPAIETFVSVSAGATHACAVTTDGRGFCWPRDGRPETSGMPERP